MPPQNPQDAQQCIFCQIASGAASARRVYEDESFVGVLDINPGNPGHVLLLSKEHYAILPEVPEVDTGRLGLAVKNVSLALLRSLKAQGTTIFVANGAAAGQRAPHLITHIIPRAEGDGVGMSLPTTEYEKGQKEALAAELSKLFGGPTSPPTKKEKKKEEEGTEEAAEKGEAGEAETKEEEKAGAEQEETPTSSALDEVADFLMKGGGSRG